MRDLTPESYTGHQEATAEWLGHCGLSNRKKTIYQGIRLQTDDEKRAKDEAKDDLPTVAHSSGVSALEDAFLGRNGSTVGNRGQSGESGESVEDPGVSF